MKKKVRKGRLLMRLGLLCIAGAMGLAGYNVWVEYQSDQAAKAVLEKLNQQIPAVAQTQKEDTPKLVIADQYGAAVDWPL